MLLEAIGALDVLNDAFAAATCGVSV